MEKYRHVVLLQFKESTTQLEIENVENAFTALKAQIPQIKGFEFGLNDTEHNPTKNKGFSHCYFLTFDNVEEFEIYESSDPHQAFLLLAGQYLQNAIVMCYLPQ